MTSPEKKIKRLAVGIPIVIISVLTVFALVWLVSVTLSAISIPAIVGEIILWGMLIVGGACFLAICLDFAYDIGKKIIK